MISAALALDPAGHGGGWPSAGLLLSAAGIELARLLLWQSRHAAPNGLLAMLHLGYLWLPIGLALTGLARIADLPLSPGDAIHALAAGAVACSIHAIAAQPLARRAVGHLRAAPMDMLGFAAVWAAAACRVWPRSAP
ncbi:MAG: NnrS family protein [Paracoccaceae bacterium]